MPIKYSCINEGSTLLAEYPPGEHPKLAEIMQKVIATVPGKEYRRKTIEDKEGGVNYHYISNGEGRIVACVTSNDMRMRTVFAFLEAVEPLVRGSACPPGNELRNGRKLLQQKMDFYNNPQNDKITALNEDINQVVDVMMDNMDKVLARGDRIDTLHDRSATLSEQAHQFQKRSTQLKRNMCWKNFKLTLMIILAVGVVIFIIVLLACKPNFSNCKSSSPPTNAETKSA
ncbi:putative Synaptobrevin [Trypanosoma vivax]|nr:vesicle-associated membrane protein [Trypanosoma vivax]KAH8607091.1 putative Synaptobrevin [Trypanosoma vivax]KAH8619895.1 putative Synaptobrevin [Trypanosoma vivax]